jgi:TP901 family phage tail tape measure protein
MANPSLIVRIAAQWNQLQASLASVKGEISTLGPKFTQLGAMATAGLTVPIVGTLGLASKAAIDFQSSFAGVRKTVEATEPEFAVLAAGLRKMATELPINVNELNKVAESAGQLGIKKDDILAFTRVMADLGVSTNLTADQAAVATARIQNIFGAAGKDTDRFGATLVALGNAGASTEQDIVNMSMRIAGAGHQVGMTQAQVLAFANGLSSVGINAEAGGSTISRTFLKINDAVMTGGSKLAEFARVSGVSAAEFKIAWEKDAASAAVMFINGLARLKGEGENVNQTIEGLVGRSILMKDTLLRASGAGDLLNKSLALGNKAWQENRALLDEAGERYKTVESQLNTLKNKFMDAAITLGQALLPVIINFVEAATPMVAKLAESVTWFGSLPEPVRLLGLMMAGLVAAIGPVLVIVGSAITAFAALSTILGTAGLVATFTALLPFLGAAGLIAAGVMAVVMVWKYWDDIPRYAKAIYDGVKTWLVDKFNAVVESIRSKVDAVTGFFGDMYEKVVGHSYVPEMMAVIATSFAGLQATMVDPAVTATNHVTAAFEQAADGTEILRSNLRFAAETIETDMAPAMEHLAEVTTKAADAANRMGAGSNPMPGLSGSLPTANPFTGAGMAHTDPAVQNYLRAGYTLGEAIALAGRAPTLIGAPHGRWTAGGWQQGLTGFAGGGHMDAGQAGIVGERGPELFIPDRSGTVVPSGGGSITLAAGAIVINNPTMNTPRDIDDLATRVLTALDRRMRASGIRLPSGV